MNFSFIYYFVKYDMDNVKTRLCFSIIPEVMYLFPCLHNALDYTRKTAVCQQRGIMFIPVGKGLCNQKNTWQIFGCGGS